MPTRHMVVRLISIALIMVLYWYLLDVIVDVGIEVRESVPRIGHRMVKGFLAVSD